MYFVLFLYISLTYKLITNIMKLLNLTVRNIKGQLATGCYSHTTNKIKHYVVVYNNTKFFGTDLETIFNNL